MSNTKASHSVSFEDKLKIIEQRKSELSSCYPLKTLKTYPSIPGITKKTASFLRIKSLYYLLSRDKEKVFLRYFFRSPLRYFLRLICSYCKKASYTRDGDFFFYGIDTLKQLQQALTNPKNLIVLGFSYCQKPLECPSGRFSDACIHDSSHPVCGQCPIGKIVWLTPKEKVHILWIPTIHYIGEKIFSITQNNPRRPVYFIITACEMTLKMFGDWGNMAGAKGVGVRLDGRICNTMKAFILSEEGIKPGLTLFTPSTEKRVLDLIKIL
jgi:hypothetical protein